MQKQLLLQEIDRGGVGTPERSRSVQRWLTPVSAALCLLVMAYFVVMAFPPNGTLALDFTQYYDAGRAMLAHSSPYRIEARVYSSAAFLQPPIFAIFIEPLALLPVQLANWVWFVLSVVFMIVGTAASVRLIQRRWPMPVGRWALFFGLTALAFAFLPVWTAIRLGQVTPLLFCLVMTALLAREEGHPMLGGVILGVAVAFKLIPAPLVVLTLWLHWWRFGLSGAGTFVLLQAVSALFYFPIFVDYWVNATGTIDTISQSVNLSLIGLARRDGAGAVALGFAFGISALMIALPFALTLRSRVRKLPRMQLDAVALLVAAMVIAAPLVEHHYMILLLFPVWLLLVQVTSERRFLELGLTAGALLTTAIPYRIGRLLVTALQLTSDSEAVGEHVLVAGVAVLYLLMMYRVVRRYSAARSWTA